MVTDEQKNPIKAAVQNSRPLRCHGQIRGGLFSRLLLSQQNEVFPYMRSRTFLLALKTLQACPIIKALIKPAILMNSGKTVGAWSARMTAWRVSVTISWSLQSPLA